VLSALDAGEPCVVVASAHAVAQRTLAPADVRGAVQTLTTGQTLDMEDLIVELDRLGYVNAPIVQLTGEFSRRGGIVDVFPPTADDPLRIEFFGDEIESLRHFSIATQRTTLTIDEAQIGPAQEIALASAQPTLELLARWHTCKATSPSPTATSTCRSWRRPRC
jgi:transcription-repair coupling factor (superfamily II helicase)